MNNTPYPLEYLASFAITFAAGMATSAALSAAREGYGLGRQQQITVAPHADTATPAHLPLPGLSLVQDRGATQ